MIFQSYLKAEGIIYDIFTHKFVDTLYTFGIFYPADPDFILCWEHLNSGRDDWKMLNYVTGYSQLLNASPYAYSRFGKGSFNYNGTKVVFSVSRGVKGDPIRWEAFELWILEKF